MNYLAFLAQAVPTQYRKAFYKGVKYLSALATVALLVLPHVADFGFSLPQWAASLTGVLTALSHLADSNTEVEDNTDYPVADTQDPFATEASDVPTDPSPVLTEDTPNPAAAAAQTVTTV